MAKELPFLKFVGNDIVRVELPNQVDADRTYLTASVTATDTSCTVLDNTTLAQNDFIVVGNYGDEKCEIVKVNGAVTRGGSLTTTAFVFNHSIDEPVTLIRYDQVAIYGSASATDTSPTIIGSATSLDVSKGFNEIQASTTYDYYYARYYNSQTTGFSSYSTAVGASGYGRLAVKTIVDDALSRTQSEIDDSSGITKEFLIGVFNEWQEWVTEGKRDWSWLRTNDYSTAISLSLDTQEYSLPTDIQDNDLPQSIINIRMRGRPHLTPLDPEFFYEKMTGVAKSYVATQFTTSDTSIVIDDVGDFRDSGSLQCEGDDMDYTARDTSTNTFSGATNISDTHEVDKEIYQNASRGQPKWYTVDYVNGSQKLLVWPLPASEYASANLYINYWKDVTAVTDFASTTVIPFTNSARYYIMAKIEEEKGDPRNLADKYMARAEIHKRNALQKELSERHSTMRTYSKPNVR